MTRLQELRKRLARLRRRRRRVRLETGFSALLLTVLWIVAAAFLADWLLEMNRLQRLIGLAACGAVAIWAFRRYTLPWLGHRETDLDMALLVQRQEQIDSDLIAAVQFESPEAAQWGSVQLEQAVIHGVALRGKQLNVMRGLSQRQLMRRTTLLLLTAAAWVALGLAATDHLSAFLQRFFLLSTNHYPTRTVIQSIVVKSHAPLGPAADAPRRPRSADAPVESQPADAPVESQPTDDSTDPPPPVVSLPPPRPSVDWSAVAGQPIDPSAPGRAPLRILYGHQVRFEVSCTGEVPESGQAVFYAGRSGTRTTLDLQPSAEAPGVFVGQLDEFREEIRYQLFLGDAWTDPGVLTVAQLPVVDVELEVELPSYAVTQEGEKTMAVPKGLRQISVVEGSRVLVKVRSASSLREVTLSVVDRANGSRPHPFRKAESEAWDDPREIWILDADDSPLAAVTELTRFEIDVTDVDGQHLQQPILGVVRIQTDAPPRIAAAIITQWVLPAARPTIYFRAIDDYGLQSVSIACEVTRADGGTSLQDFDVYRLSPGDTPPKNLEPDAGYAFDLGRLGLSKGDRVAATLRAVDFRGGREGKTATADPLLFQVTDEQGILASMMETDRQSARQLKTMIQRQLGIGESP
ncbi:MAG: hypothetical protein JXB62_01420 [Pirellulales bacterium]|nr:hypothetical protein [Pirellulales bacterium]